MTIFDFTLPAGDSATLEVTVRNQDLTVMNLSGLMLKWSAQRLDDPVATLVDLTVGAGLTVQDAANGRVDVDIPKATIIVPGIWRHELEVVDGLESQTALEGEITVTPTINSST